MNEIDWGKLDEIRETALYMRRTAFLDLSDIYVPGEGDNPIAMIIGEAPGAQEEIKKRPFIGPAGLVLRQLMDITGLYTGQTPQLGQANCWLTNVVHFRPPKNRTPTNEEILMFRQYLRDEWLAIGRPSIIIPVGGVALQAVYGRKLSILRVAGKVDVKRSRDGKQMLYRWPMIHPSFGLRNKAAQPLLEKDWEGLSEWITKAGVLND